MTGPEPAMERTGVWVHAVIRDIGAGMPGAGMPGIGIPGPDAADTGAAGVDAAETDGVTGVGGGRVRAVRAAGLTAIVSTVDLGEFGEQPLARNLENVQWLETVARAHHRVVETVGRRGAVIPTRLATIYRDDRCVAAMLTERRADFAAALDRVTGRTEWGVKAYASAAKASASRSYASRSYASRSYASAGSAAGAARSETAAAGAGAHDARPGTRYLRQRRAQLSGRDEARQATVANAEAIHRALAQKADADRRHPAQAPGLSGRTDWMVLNGTYLVSEDLGTRFADAVAALARRYPDLELELTGPWPPYSFAVVDEATDR
ncbi:GvpL/GvpF family gas vesicle protein [Rugosimonospora africana]|uniref:Gas vesicle protein n=1 Tax=Rugosimonospora africana TaxID=556532 RepID=A0A8J3VWA3_9ACTN|nr:GvpL/GvpF family gas vesicle protein [Rugosimonospora africana]GIH20739.1 gas vesicle protein [Rugosimonospora africana]